MDKFNYTLPYPKIFGGATAMTPEHFRRVNGYSNQFWGWGGEDDDMWSRVHFHGLVVLRRNTGMYRMIKHESAEGTHLENGERWSLLETGQGR